MEEENVFLLLSVALIVGVFVAVHFASSESCSQRSISFKDHKYGVFSGCMVKHKERWIPLENIRGFDDKG